MLLAKQLKIKMLKTQREYIREELQLLPIIRPTGNSTFKYVGELFPEVIHYFVHQGFDITLLEETENEFPIYIFNISEKIKLNEKELEQTEKYRVEDEDKELLNKSFNHD